MIKRCESIAKLKYQFTSLLFGKLSEMTFASVSIFQTCIRDRLRIGIFSSFKFWPNYQNKSKSFQLIQVDRQYL